MSAPAGQHLTALERAQAMRLAQASVCQDLRSQPSWRAGALRLAEVLEQPTTTVMRMRLDRLLPAPYGFGPEHERQLLRVASVNRACRVDDLTDRQRDVIATELRRRAASWRPRTRAAETRSTTTEGATPDVQAR